MQANSFIPAIFTLVILSACRKEPASVPLTGHPKMNYTLVNLELESWNAKGIDIDGDNKKDFAFEVFPVGDPVQQRDKIRFYAYSTIHTSFLNDDLDNPPMLEKGETVKPVHPGYSWWPISASMLAEKILTLDGSVIWEGVFKTAKNNYLPVKMTKNDRDYFGWIELSIDQAGSKLIIHQIALSTEADKVVKTGF